MTLANERMCAREGCPRRVPTQRSLKTCSMLCEAVHVELVNSEALCNNGLADGHHWSLAVALNDALAAYRHNDNRLFRLARDVGITTEQWREAKRPRV